jgi:hypothetical protein
MYCEEGRVYVEKEDQCMICKNFKKGVACPLLQALGLGMVLLEGTMYVTNCGFFEEYKRHLKIVNANEAKKQGKEKPKK